MTQNEMVLAHLKTRGPLTPLAALRMYGINRLAARIKDLRDDGHEIEREMVRMRTRAGLTSVARYSMGRDS